MPTSVDGLLAQGAVRHPAAWRFLLPRRVHGPVVLANLDPLTTQNLLRSYPSAIVLSRAMLDVDGVARGAIWDGQSSPFRPRTVALVICDDRDGKCAEALAPALAETGQLVAIVRSVRPYRFALFPTPEQVRAVVGRAGRGLGNLTLRVSCRGQELAVRVAASPDSAGRLGNHQQVLADLPSRLGSNQRAFAFPEAVASGSAEGISWAAERWLKGSRVRASHAWRPSGRGWAVLRAIATELAFGAPTGHAGDGWARGWITGSEVVAPALIEEILIALAPIEAEGMTTAWCHGDLSPGNVLLRRPPRPPVVIDWERARPDAPAGLDAVFAEVCRILISRRWTFGEAAAWLAHSATPELAATVISGRSFAKWDRPLQQALLLATVIQFVTGDNEGRSTDRWTDSWGQMHVQPMMKALQAVQ